MKIEQLINELKYHHKVIRSIIALLHEIDKLNCDQEKNLRKIRQRIENLKKITRDYTPFSVNNIEEWVAQFEEGLTKTEENLRRRLGMELEKQLGQQGIHLTGQYPELKAGLFTIELDFDQWKVRLWYGPRQEKLSECPMSAAEIVKQVEKSRKELGSQISEEELVKKLRRAYERVSQNTGEYVPIIKVLGELAYLIQSARFHQDPRKEHYKGYSRADFSLNLFRIKRFLARNPSLPQLHLKVATRSLTRRRSDFLWVPENEEGKGSTYSHLKFEEKQR